jgi:hypothetical protein
MTKPIMLTKSNCVHHWDIEPSHKVVFSLAPNDIDGEGGWKPLGSRSPGTCRNCGASRMFSNSTPHSSQLY